MSSRSIRRKARTQVIARVLLVAKVRGVVGASVVARSTGTVRYAVSANHTLTPKREFGSQILTIVGAIVRALLSRVVLATVALGGRAVASDGILDLVHEVAHDEWQISMIEVYIYFRLIKTRFVGRNIVLYFKFRVSIGFI